MTQMKENKELFNKVHKQYIDVILAQEKQERELKELENFKLMLTLFVVSLIVLFFIIMAYFTGKGVC